MSEIESPLKFNITFENIKDWWKDHPDVPPLCGYWEEATTFLISEVTRLETENKDLKFKASCHTSACIADYEELEKRVKELQAKLNTAVVLREAQWEAIKQGEGRIKELEKGIERHKKQSNVWDPFKEKYISTATLIDRELHELVKKER